jgi:hypothetical protein
MSQVVTERLPFGMQLLTGIINLPAKGRFALLLLMEISHPVIMVQVVVLVEDQAVEVED